MNKLYAYYTSVGAALIVASSMNAQDASYALNGGAGLIDMPTAEMLPDGETSWTFTKTPTMYGGTLTFQLLPNLETAVHFTTVPDWDGGTLYDQSIDLKYRLFEETGYFPSIAIGFRDFLSNGAFSSEYIVASKSIGDSITLTGGLGWGRLGSYNPIGSFGTRPTSGSTAIDTDQFFKGDMAFFGGVEWDTPVRGLSVKAEYSSDAYTNEQAFGGYDPKSPFNFGLEYEAVRGVSVGAYYNYGNDFGFRVTLSANPNNPVVSPDLGTGPIPVNPRPVGYSTDETWAKSALARNTIAQALSPVIEGEGMTLEAARITGNTIDLYVTNNTLTKTSKGIGRIARALSVALPPSVEVFRITPVSNGLATTTVEIRRNDLEKQVERPNAGPDSWQTTRFYDAESDLGDGAWERDAYPKFSWSINPRVPINLASGGSSVSIDVLLNASASYQISNGFSLNASATQKIYGNIGDDATPSTSPTPVRSNYALYSDQKGPSIDRLTADYLFKVTPSIYGRVSAGYLERMFAGVNGEILWKPANQNWGLGVEVSAVKQRSYDNMLGFEEYETVVGHGSIYWDTGFYDLEAQVDVGTYLAGDFGSTLRLSRRFDNGWEVSGYMTITDMPFAEFGEGNFAKGITVSIPLRWTVPFETRSKTSIGLATLGGDGGAQLNINNRLYPMIRDYEVIDFNESWGAYWQ